MTQSTPTLSETIGAELGGLIALGFSENQAKTIIVSAAITSANESKKIVPAPSAPAPKLVKLFDADGDPWEPIANSDLFSYKGTDGRILADRTRQQIEDNYGPVKEVWA